MCIYVFPALHQSLLMGVNLSDIGQHGIRKSEQGMLDIEDHLVHDGHFRIPDNIIISADEACGAVLHGKDTVIRFSCSHGRCHLVKGLHIHEFRIFAEELDGRRFRVGSGHTGIAYAYALQIQFLSEMISGYIIGFHLRIPALQLLQKLVYGLSADRMYHMGCDLRQGLQNEGAVLHFHMGDQKSLFADHGIVIEKDIQIQGPRTPVHDPFPPRFLLDIMQNGQQLLR